MSLPEFSVKHSVFGNMFTLIVFVVGLIVAMTATRELFPKTELDVVSVMTTYPGASAEEVESQITIPLEEEIRGIDGVDKFLSGSIEGLSSLAITVDPDAKDVQRVITDITRRIDRVKNLPDGAEKPRIDVIATRATVIHITVAGTAGEERLRERALQMKAMIEEVDGVSMVEKVGWREPEIWVEANAEILIEKDLSLFEIINSVARQNVNVPGGKIRAGDSEVVLRTIGEFRTPAEIEDVVIRSNPDGRHIRVGDVAVARKSFAEETILLRADGERGVMLSVIKKDSGDTIRISEKVRKLVDEIKLSFEKDVNVSVIDLEAYLVKRRLKVLLTNGFCGLALVMLALPLLLNVRIAIVTAIGIPFAFLSAILVMGYLNISINMMTMFGMILVVGMLVDDAIIIAENIFRHMEQGKTPKDAAIAGATEVMWPVTATVLTTIAAFIPLMFLPGIAGKFLKWVPIVVIITLGASLFEALVILPCHVAGLVRPLKRDGDGATKGVRTRSSEWSASIQTWYVGVLKKVLAHRGIFVVGMVLVFSGAVGLAVSALKIEVFPADLIDMFTVKTTAPQGTSLLACEAAVARVEKRILATVREGEVDNILTFVGQHDDPHVVALGGSRYALMLVYMRPSDTRERKANEIIAELRTACADIEGLEKAEFEMVKGGPPSGKQIEIKVVGREYVELDKISEEVKEFLGTTGCVDVNDDHEPGKDELTVDVDKPEAARLGLDVQTVAVAVRAGFAGAIATVIRSAEEETKVRVRLSEGARGRVESLRALNVLNKAGKLVALDKVARFVKGRGVTGIEHYNGSRAVTVTAALNDDENVTVREVVRDVKDKFADLSARYPGCRLVFGGEWESSSEMMWSMIRAFVIALLLIYAILVIQFQSALQPFVVLVSIPFGLIGVVLALILHNKPLSMMAMLGIVGMTGVVVNDAIVLVTFINDLRRKGMPIEDAIIEGAKRRVRPIILTSVTTVLGLAPTIIGIGGYEPFVAPAAIVLAYGLVFATFLTLLVVPCMYSIGMDLRRLVAGIIDRRPSGAEPSA